jgi:hypothetical protein
MFLLGCLGRPQKQSELLMRPPSVPVRRMHLPEGIQRATSIAEALLENQMLNYLAALLGAREIAESSYQSPWKS